MMKWNLTHLVQWDGIHFGNEVNTHKLDEIPISLIKYKNIFLRIVSTMGRKKLSAGYRGTEKHGDNQRKLLIIKVDRCFK